MTVIEFSHPIHGKAILLFIDTQGIFSAEDDFSESVSIFAISLMLSSIQIYNLRGGLDRLQLDQLRLFAMFGQILRTANPDSNSPFQRLIITIRDWELDDNLGFEAGNKLLQEFLNTLQETQEGEELRNSIQNLFNKTDCMVMARPGDHINREDFEGSRKWRIY